MSESTSPAIRCARKGQNKAKASAKAANATDASPCVPISPPKAPPRNIAHDTEAEHKSTEDGGNAATTSAPVGATSAKVEPAAEAPVAPPAPVRPPVVSVWGRGRLKAIDVIVGATQSAAVAATSTSGGGATAVIAEAAKTLSSTTSAPASAAGTKAASSSGKPAPGTGNSNSAQSAAAPSAGGKAAGAGKGNATKKAVSVGVNSGASRPSVGSSDGSVATKVQTIPRGNEGASGKAPAQAPCAQDAQQSQPRMATLSCPATQRATSAPPVPATPHAPRRHYMMPMPMPVHYLFDPQLGVWVPPDWRLPHRRHGRGYTHSRNNGDSGDGDDSAETASCECQHAPCADHDPAQHPGRGASPQHLQRSMSSSAVADGWRPTRMPMRLPGPWRAHGHELHPRFSPAAAVHSMHACRQTYNGGHAADGVGASYAAAAYVQQQDCAFVPDGCDRVLWRNNYAAQGGYYGRPVQVDGRGNENPGAVAGVSAVSVDIDVTEDGGAQVRLTPSAAGAATTARADGWNRGFRPPTYARGSAGHPMYTSPSAYPRGHAYNAYAGALDHRTFGNSGGYHPDTSCSHTQTSVCDPECRTGQGHCASAETGRPIRKASIVGSAGATSDTSADATLFAPLFPRSRRHSGDSTGPSHKRSSGRGKDVETGRSKGRASSESGEDECEEGRGGRAKAAAKGKQPRPRNSGENERKRDMHTHEEEEKRCEVGETRADGGWGWATNTASALASCPSMASLAAFSLPATTNTSTSATTQTLTNGSGSLVLPIPLPIPDTARTTITAITGNAAAVTTVAVAADDIADDEWGALRDAHQQLLWEAPATATSGVGIHSGTSVGDTSTESSVGAAARDAGDVDDGRGSMSSATTRDSGTSSTLTLPIPVPVHALTQVQNGDQAGWTQAQPRRLGVGAPGQASTAVQLPVPLPATQTTEMAVFGTNASAHSLLPTLALNQGGAYSHTQPYGQRQYSYASGGLSLAHNALPAAPSGDTAFDRLMSSPLTMLTRTLPAHLQAHSMHAPLSLPQDTSGYVYGYGYGYGYASLPYSRSYPLSLSGDASGNTKPPTLYNTASGGTTDSQGVARPKKPHPSSIKVTGEMAAIEAFVRDATEEDIVRRLLALEQMVLRKRTAHLTEKNLLLAALSRYKSKVAALVRELEGGGALPEWSQRYRNQAAMSGMGSMAMGGAAGYSGSNVQNYGSGEHGMTMPPSASADGCGRGWW